MKTNETVKPAGIDWRQKLTSRKLWAAVVGVVVGLAAAFGIQENDYAQIVGVVTSAVSVVSYIFGESSVDAARATAPQFGLLEAELETEKDDETE